MHKYGLDWFMKRIGKKIYRIGLRNNCPSCNGGNIAVLSSFIIENEEQATNVFNSQYHQGYAFVDKRP